MGLNVSTDEITMVVKDTLIFNFGPSSVLGCFSMEEVVELALLWTGDHKVLILRIYAELGFLPTPKAH